MKKLVLFIALTLALVPVLAQDLLDRAVSVDIDNLTLEEALFYLMDKEGVHLSFSNDLIPDKRVTLQRKNIPLSEVLYLLLKEVSIDFRVVGRQVVLYRRDLVLPPAKKKFTISGFIRDEQTRELLIGASIYDRNSGKGTVTNEYGFYSLSLTEGEVDLQFSYLGYVTFNQAFKLMEDREINLQLSASLTLAEVVVIAKDSSLLQRNSAMSVNEIDINDVERLPKLAGESDVIRTVHLLPGIQTGADGIGGIHVRGGNVGQNLILIDDVPVYDVSHAAGIFSIFNTDAIRSAKLVKGGFPARYGGRVSSVLDIRTKEGNLKEFKAKANVGLLTASVSAEGPMRKDYSSFFVSGRGSFLDLYLRPVSRYYKDLLGETGETAYDFYDFNAKLNFSFTEQDKVYISVYAGGDDFRNFGQASDVVGVTNVLVNDTTFFRLDTDYSENLSWGNTVAAFRWNHLFNNKLFLNSTVTYSRLELDLAYSSTDSIVDLAEDLTIFRDVDFGAYLSSIEDFGAKLDFNLIPSTEHYLRFGVGTTRHLFNPGVLFFNESVSQGTGTDVLPSRVVQSSEFYAYFEDEIDLGKLMLNVGFRATNLSVETKTYQFLEPRVSAYYQVFEKFGIKASYSKMTQYLHLLSRSGIGLPTDLWVPSTRNIEPQVAYQYVAGFDLSLGKSASLEVETYHKRMENLLTYSEGANILGNWEENVTVGSGTSSGIEFMLKKRFGQNAKGWLSYTYSRTNRTFEEINFNRSYPYKYDRTHDFKLAFTHQFNKWLQLSTTWQIATGLAFTLPLETFTSNSVPGAEGFPIIVTLTEEKNNFRLPDYHRLDLSLNFAFHSKKLSHRFSLGGYNLYSRRNPLYYNWVNGQVVRVGDELVQPQRFVEVRLIPFLPSLSYSLQF